MHQNGKEIVVMENRMRNVMAFGQVNGLNCKKDLIIMINQQFILENIRKEKKQVYGIFLSKELELFNYINVNILQMILNKNLVSGW
ncbi:unnamed protein product [Paramecium octaurelia]|uniref:Uncharacterized protein n=1 Tax=Paramecium octaurelia TaxID=43137 RepID=A0A8S1V4W9_PAROT|nr:unnamed protein product [Paramecium octaurelia]